MRNAITGKADTINSDLSNNKIAQQLAQRMVMNSNYQYRSTRLLWPTQPVDAGIHSEMDSPTGRGFRSISI